MVAESIQSHREEGVSYFQYLIVRHPPPVASHSCGFYGTIQGTKFLLIVDVHLK